MNRRTALAGAAASIVCVGLVAGPGLMKSAVRLKPGAGTTGPEPRISVRDHGAVGDGLADDTEAFRQAFDAIARAGGGTLAIPAGTYVLTPDILAPNYLSAAAAQFGPLHYAVELRSNIHVAGEGATIKVRDGVSSNERPRNFALFYSENVLANLAFTGIAFDLNGRNNPISPRRADVSLPLESRYGRQHHAAIMLEGLEGKADDVLIQDCTFSNCAGVNYIVAGRVAPVSGMGRRWRILRCRFRNSGLDTYDHSAIYLWCDDAEVSNCSFENDEVYGPTPDDVTGLAAAIETHGARTVIADNLIVGANRAIIVSENLSWGYHAGPAGYPVSDVAVRGNVMRATKYCGVDLFFRGAEGVAPPRNISVTDNLIAMTADDTNVDATNFPAAINMIGDALTVAPVVNLLVARNRARRERSQNGRSAHFMSIALLVRGFGPLRLEANDVSGFARGLYVYTLADATCSDISLTRNRWTDPDGGEIPDIGTIGRTGIFILAQGGSIESFSCNDAFIDTRSSLGWTRAIAVVRQGNMPNTRIGRFEIGRDARFDPRFRPGQNTIGVGSIRIDRMVDLAVAG